MGMHQLAGAARAAYQVRRGGGVGGDGEMEVAYALAQKSSFTIFVFPFRNVCMFSQINVRVTLEEPTSTENYYTVEFGNGFEGVGASGIAYDVGELISPLPDRFDVRKDGNVAVFANRLPVDRHRVWVG